jgi:hypothetical protein
MRADDGRMTKQENYTRVPNPDGPENGEKRGARYWSIVVGFNLSRQ